METMKQFTLFRNEKSIPTRINRKAVLHITRQLELYYPEIATWSIAKRADFVIFLFEKAFKEKVVDYVCSWELPNRNGNGNIF